MVWGGKNEDEDETRGSPIRAWHVWAACLIGAVMPTMVLATVAQWVDGRPAPAFIPALYIGLFTLGVVVMRPWTFR